jgi:hypothetical protein
MSKINAPHTLIGKTILVGITKLDQAGEPIEQLQFYGVISIAT